MDVSKQKAFLLRSVSVLALLGIAAFPAHAQGTLTLSGQTLFVTKPLTLAMPQDTPQNTPPSQPDPDKKPKRYFYIGPDFGVFLPTNSRTQSRFGSAWFDFGPGIGAIAGIRSGGKISPDLHFASQDNNGNHVFLALLGVEYKYPLLSGRPAGKKSGDKEPKSGESGNEPQTESKMRGRPSVLPYVGASGDLAVVDLHSDEDNVHSGVRTGIAGSLFTGLRFGERAFLEARYRATSTIKTFDLSGVNISAGYRWRF